jgi:hypothetical protein
MGSSTRTFAILGSIVLVAIVLAGLGLKNLSAHPEPNPQAGAEFQPDGSSGK